MKNPSEELAKFTGGEEQFTRMRLIYVNTRTLAFYIGKMRAAAVSSASILYDLNARDPFSIPNGMVMHSMMEDNGANLAAGIALLEVLVNSPEYIEAAKILEPLLLAEKTHNEEIRARSIRLQEDLAAAKRALEEKMAKALEAAQKSPEVIKALSAHEAALARHQKFIEETKPEI